MARKIQLDAILKLVDVQINPQVFRRISQSVAGLPANVQSLNANLAATNTQAFGLNRTLTGTTNQLTAAQKASKLFLQKMAQFAILLPTFVTLNKSIQGSVEFLFDFDSALRDIVRADVRGLAGQMEAIGDAALKTARDLGESAITVLEFTKIFIQAGFDIEKSQEKARAAILATQVSTLKAAEAVEIFIAADEQFGAQGKNSAAVLDKLAKVEDVAAANAQDVADAFRTGGNSLAEFAKSIDDSIGLIVALREQTRKSGNEIGTFFKTLQTRIFAAGEARDALEALGVTVENLDGSLRPTLEVLTELAQKFDGLTEAQVANAAKAIGGVRQFESLIATLKSVERANELARKSAAAAGTAEEKRIITDEKLERQFGKLIAAGQTFAEALGDAGLQDTLAGALKIATSLLNVFTKAVTIVDELGGSITPLLALGGVALGKGIFGLGKGAAGGGAAAAQTRGISTQALNAQLASAVDPFRTQLSRLGQVLSSGTQYLGVWGKALLVSSTITTQHGGQLNADQIALKAHSDAVKANINAIKASESAALKNKEALLQSNAALIGLSLAASLVPAAFGFVEDKLRDSGTVVGGLAADVVKLNTEGTSLAAQFAVLGPQAAAVAFAFGVVKESITTVITAIEDELKAREEITKLEKDSANITKARLKLSGAGINADEFGEALIDSLITNVQAVDPGKDLAAGILKSFQEFAASSAAQKLNLQDVNLGEALLGDVGTLKDFIRTQEQAIKARAEEIGTIEEFDQLFAMLGDKSLQSGEAFAQLVKVLGAGAEGIDRAGRIITLSFEEFQKAQSIIDFADGVRTLNQELELAKLGPEVMADSVVRLRTELQLSEREFENTARGIQEGLANLFNNLGTFGNIGVGDDASISAAEFFNTINQGVRELDPEKVREFNEFIRGLPDAQKEAADELTKLIDKQFQTEFDIQKKRNALQEEVLKREREINEEEAKAAINAMEATKKFGVELQKFGDNVTTDILDVFQNVSLGDVDDVLAGASKLPQGIQEIIKNAFDPLEEAQNDLQVVGANTQATLEILAQKLEVVNKKLEDEANIGDRASLIADKRALELEIETTKQEGLISATEAKIKLLEAEKKAAEDAAEAERKRQERLEKLADATRAFDKELKEAQRSFEEFVDEKLGDLLQDQADAASDLKDAQQETLESTQSLADAYSTLVDAQFAFNNAIAEARIRSNLLSIDIGKLTGSISTFDGELSLLQDAFNNVLRDANITLQERINLEQQLAEETLSFLEQAKQEITQAGLTVFGQTGAENQALGQGIAGLQLIVDQLGGSFEAFQAMSPEDFAEVSQSLLNLPVELRQQILDALQTLPGTVNLGGFSVEQLTQALGQIGTGVAPEVGLPSIEELNTQQVEQLTKLQDLALQDAQLQFQQVAQAEEQIAIAEQQLEASKILEQRATENLQLVSDGVLEQNLILEQANAERKDLMAQVIAADDRNTLQQIEKEAELFAEQNTVFREVGLEIVKGISSAISSKLSMIDAQNELNAATGHVPNFAGGNLRPSEAAGVLRAASREKKKMPFGAKLAVANTKEAIIPMYDGNVPNFAEGNLSPIAAGIEAAKGVDQAVVAAISRSITEALSNLQANSESREIFSEMASRLGDIRGELEDIAASNSVIQTNTTATTTGGTTTQTQTGEQAVRITLETNQNNSVNITGLESLIENIRQAVRDTTLQQIDAQLEPLLGELSSIFQVLRERGLQSSLGQPG